MPSVPPVQLVNEWIVFLFHFAIDKLNFCRHVSLPKTRNGIKSNSVSICFITRQTNFNGVTVIVYFMGAAPHPEIFQRTAHPLDFLRNRRHHCERSEAIQLHHSIASGITTEVKGFWQPLLKNGGISPSSCAPSQCSFWIASLCPQ